MPKLSIIVPVYNVGKYLYKCLYSLSCQTLKDIEIICINDGSTDNSLDIINSFAEKDNRFKLINIENIGQSVARNKGLEVATGEYLGFTDSDDWVDKDYFEKLYNAAIKYNCDIACAGYRRCKKGNGSIRKRYKKYEILSDINSKITADNVPGDNYVWNKIYKKSSWDKLGFKFTPGRYFEDIAILTKILYYMGDMVTVPGTYYHYRRRSDSTVADTTNIRIKSDFEWAMNELKTFALEHNIDLRFPNKSYSKKVCINMFKIPILKIYYYKKLVEYRLFGLIPFMQKIVR